MLGDVRLTGGIGMEGAGFAAFPLQRLRKAADPGIGRRGTVGVYIFLLPASGLAFSAVQKKKYLSLPFWRERRCPVAANLAQPGQGSFKWFFIKPLYDVTCVDTRETARPLLPIVIQRVKGAVGACPDSLKSSEIRDFPFNPVAYELLRGGLPCSLYFAAT